MPQTLVNICCGSSNPNLTSAQTIEFEIANGDALILVVVFVDAKERFVRNTHFR